MHRRNMIISAGGLTAAAVTSWQSASAASAIETAGGSAAPGRAPAQLSRALIARGPDRALRDKLMLFGQFVGSWSFTLTELTPAGEVTMPGVWHFGWILEGRGIQDVWIVPSNEYGTTIRVYDPTTDVWRVTWHGPRRSRFVDLEGGREGDDIVLLGQLGEQPTRWIFSSISRHRFHWRNELSFDGGVSYTVVQQLSARRR